MKTFPAKPITLSSQENQRASPCGETKTCSKLACARIPLGLVTNVGVSVSD